MKSDAKERRGEEMSAERNPQDKWRKDPRSVQELISVALTEVDEEAAWEPVTVIHYRADREVLDAARKLCESACPRERELGVDVLGQLGIPERAFPDESLGLILKVLEREWEPEVLSAAVIALGHLHDARAVEPLTRFKNHPDPNVRYGVVRALLTPEDDLAIAALIELSTDEDSDVRDWATFGLGSQIDTDTPAIREALVQRLTDEDDDTRAEALVGLAVRRDERVVQPLIEELTSDCVGTLAVEAAETLGDPRLHPALFDLSEWWDLDEKLLQRAIVACAPDGVSSV
jgi:HEAT repeat protein